MAGSSLGGVRSGVGSSLGAPTAATVFTDLRQVIQTVANAFAAPTDTPVLDMVRRVQDGTGARVQWSFSTTTGWKGVQEA